MDGVYYNQAAQAVLVTGGGGFPASADIDWDSAPEAPGCIDIEEWQDAYLRFYSAVPPGFSMNLKDTGENSGDSRFINRFEKLQHHANPTYRVNFKNYVGYSLLAGFRVKVTNRKITEAQFNAMLDNLCDDYAALIFSCSQIAGMNYRKDQAGRDSLYLQYLLIRRHLLHAAPGLDSIAALIHRDMHERFVSAVVETPINRVREVDSTALLNLFSRPAALGKLAAADHLLCAAPLAAAVARCTGQALFPAQLHAARRERTVDTPENRFVKFFLKALEQRLAAIKQVLGQGTFLNPDIGADIERLEKSLGRFLSEPRWREVGAMRHLPTQSTVLHRRAGYRELFWLYSRLQLLSRHDPLLDFAALADLKDVPLLYEYWCFFQVKRELDRQLGEPRSGSLVPQETNGEQTVPEGLRLDYDNGASLYYNPTCVGEGSGELASYSHNLRPDILLIFRGRKLVLDAKYKGFYSSEATIGTPKDEDINKMHGYRDAIRNVWGALALYPGKESRIHRAFDASDEYKYQGVGALALRPGGCGEPEAGLESPVAEPVRRFFEAVNAA